MISNTLGNRFRGARLLVPAMVFVSAFCDDCLSSTESALSVSVSAPTYSITQDTGDTGATDTSVTLTATVSYNALWGDPQYTWTVNGADVGESSGSFTFSSEDIGLFTVGCEVEIYANFNCQSYDDKDSDSVEIDVVDPGSPDPQWRDSALSQGRKISLSGMPMPDVAQHQEGESDYEPEETHVDALTLDLRHSVTDIHVPVGSDHFALEARRSLGQEVWTTNSIPMDERPDLPFGPCWSSPVSPFLQIIQDGGTFRTFIATDHNGQTYTMKGGMWWDDAKKKPVPTFYKKPTSAQSALSLRGVDMDITDWDTTNAVVVLTLENGTVINYATTATVFFDSEPNEVGGGNTRAKGYYRGLDVTDRTGLSLTYNYDDAGSSLFPTSIVASTGQELLITPSADGRRIDRIEDPRGHHVDYIYTNGMLSVVERMDGGETSYGYVGTLEKDTRDVITPSYNIIDYHHLTIGHIADANGNTNSFSFTKPERFDYSTDVAAESNRLDQIGNNHILSSITRPDGSVVGFSEANGPLGNVKDWDMGTFTLNTDRTNVVTDVNGNQWSYVFSDPHVTDPLSSSPVRLFEYKSLDISGPYGAAESYRFGALDMNMEYGLEPLAITAQTNFSGQGETFAYDGAIAGYYKPSAKTNALDGVTSFSYTNRYGNQVESETDALGRHTLYLFDGLGNRTNATVYASTAKVVKLSESWMEYGDTDFPNFMTRKTVKKVGDETEPWIKDMVTKYEPHRYGKVGRQITDPDGMALTTVFDYDENNNLISVTDPRGNETVNVYDELNRLTHIRFYDGSATNGTLKCTKRFWYDLRSNKTWEKDENNHYTFYQYNEFNQLTATVRIMDESYSGPSSGTSTYSAAAADIVSSSEYNPDGTLYATVDPRGLRSEFYYDDLRRLTNSVVDPGPSPHLNYETVYAYSTSNNFCGGITLPPYKFMPTTVTDPRGYETETIYDALNRPVETRAEITGGSMSRLSTSGYDEVGNLRFATNWVSATEYLVTETRYDGLNRPVQTIMAKDTIDEAETGVRYTSTGLKWQTTNELDRVSTVEYDAAGRPVKTISPELAGGNSAVTETGYDANGNIAWVEDAMNNVTTNTYDYHNRLVRTEAPAVSDAGNGGAMTRPVVVTTYDGVGNVTSVTDARDNTTTNIYNAANLLVETRAPEVGVYGQGPMRPVTYNHYDKGGNITNTVDANTRSVKMYYDIAGRLTNTLDAVGNTISFRYDENGNQCFLTDGNTNTTEFVYDGLNRKTSTIYPDTSHEDAVYDFIGNRTKRVDCNGIETTYDYDGRNRLQYVTYPLLDEYFFIYQLRRRRIYDYDDAGNLRNVTESKGYAAQGGSWVAYESLPHADVSYAYDALNRVTNETSMGVTHTYGYDLNGNRTSATYGISGREVEWKYDALNRISEIHDLTMAYAGTNTVGPGSSLQTAINAASAGELILVEDGSYGPVVLTNGVTLKSLNGPGSAIITASGGRAALLQGGSSLIGFTLTGGSLTSTNAGAGAFVDVGCTISDCIITSNSTALCSDITVPGGKGGGLYLRGSALRCTISSNTAWNGAGAYLEDGATMADCTVSSNTASGVNSYGGGLYLQDGATAVNCMIAHNTATDGGGLFFEQGGLAQGVTSSSNEVSSIGGAGAFLWAGGTLRNGIIEANTATNTYARGGAGIMFFDEGGLVEDSLITGNTSATNAGVGYHYSASIDPGRLGTVNNSILWNNGSQSTVWSGTGNQTADPATVTNAPTGARVSAVDYDSSQDRITKYFYDLNSNPVKRIYPSRVEENRTYDAMNRLLTLRTEDVGQEALEIIYDYDAVGSARQMTQIPENLEGKAPPAVYTWNYDDRYRLLEETVATNGSAMYSTFYSWDNADNRLSRTNYVGGSWVSTTIYTNNALNQLTGWGNGATNVTYAYDANGNRTNMTRTAGGSSVNTSYMFDEDNRLVNVALNGSAVTHTFAYDYRSRRVYRETPDENGATNFMYCVFDGGLSIQEYEVETPNSQLQTSNLQTEFIRGEGMGGGVGGMVYSIRKDTNGKEDILCSHANHRGDVIARSDSGGAFTSFALYEAYGKRPYEWGDDPDRQKANTKEEEKDLDLLNEGMRYRDLETGVFLTRDPIGYGDGPNVYCYVHCNPITHFDPLGLASKWNPIGWVGVGVRGAGSLMEKSKLPIIKQTGRTVIDAGNCVEGVGELCESAIQRDGAYAKESAHKVAKEGLDVLGVGELVMGESVMPGREGNGVTGSLPVPSTYASIIGSTMNDQWQSWDNKMKADDHGRGMKRWHMLSSANIASQRSITEWVMGITVGSIGHEIEPGGFRAEVSGDPRNPNDGQGLFGNLVDIPGDIAANTIGFTAGLLLPDPWLEPFSQVAGGLIPGPYNSWGNHVDPGNSGVIGPRITPATSISSEEGN